MARYETSGRRNRDRYRETRENEEGRRYGNDETLDGRGSSGGNEGRGSYRSVEFEDEQGRISDKDGGKSESSNRNEKTATAGTTGGS
jgi:hypothetical protein